VVESLVWSADEGCQGRKRWKLDGTHGGQTRGKQVPGRAVPKGIPQMAWRELKRVGHISRRTARRQGVVEGVG